VRHGHLGHLDDDVPAMARNLEPIFANFSRSVVNDHGSAPPGSPISAWSFVRTTNFSDSMLLSL